MKEENQVLKEQLEIAIEYFELMKTITCKHAIRRTVAKALFLIKDVEQRHKRENANTSV